MGKKVGAIMLQFEYLNRMKMPWLEGFLERLQGFFTTAPRDYP